MPSYSAKLLHYFFNLEHIGTIDSEKNVFSIEEGSQEQGNIIKLMVICVDNRLDVARFQCYGDTPALAACEYVCRWLEGKTVQQASYLTVEQILKDLGLSSLHIHTATRLVDLIKKLLAHKRETL